MKKLRHDDLYALEDYGVRRSEFRARVMAHKKNRNLPLGEHASLYFEDRLTIQYQIQEMLRAERIFERAGIDQELAAYNPLVPDGANWKATFMLEYEDVAERQVALTKLVGVEERMWMQVGDNDRVIAFADEDLPRATEEKTASVHFLRYELTPSMVEAVKSGAAVSAGIDHDEYRIVVDLPTAIRESLLADLD